MLVQAFVCGLMSRGFKHLRRTWLVGACCGPPGCVREEGSSGWRPRFEAWVRPASGSGAAFVRQTASGSASGPGSTHSGRSAPGSHRLDADLGTQRRVCFRKEATQITHVMLSIGGFRVICAIRKQAGTFVECQVIRKHFADKNPAVFLAVDVSRYCKTWWEKEKTKRVRSTEGLHKGS